MGIFTRLWHRATTTRPEPAAAPVDADPPPARTPSTAPDAPAELEAAAHSSDGYATADAAPPSSRPGTPASSANSNSLLGGLKRAASVAGKRASTGEQPAAAAQDDVGKDSKKRGHGPSNSISRLVRRAIAPSKSKDSPTDAVEEEQAHIDLGGGQAETATTVLPVAGVVSAHTEEGEMKTHESARDDLARLLNEYAYFQLSPPCRDRPRLT